MLKGILFPNMAETAFAYVVPDFAFIHRELARQGVNLTLLWTEYCKKCESNGATPYMYTQFCEKYRQWARITKATMRIQNKPGEAMEVDWAGNTLDIHDPVTGEVSKACGSLAVISTHCSTIWCVCIAVKTAYRTPAEAESTTTDALRPR